MEDWIDKLTRVIHADKPLDETRTERGTVPVNIVSWLIDSLHVFFLKFEKGEDCECDPIFLKLRTD